MLSGAIFILVIVATISTVVLLQNTKSHSAPTVQPPNKSDLIRVTSPQPNATIQSPLTVEGEARGNWYFEATFPVRLLDANGTELAAVPARAQGEWMTQEFVPFTVELRFPEPTTKTGVLVLQKDNPSGLPANADELRVPVIFSK